MNAKKWIKIFVLLSFVGVGIVGGVNYFVDPLWNFSHSNKFNSIQAGFDERQQKTNFLYHQEMKNFDGLLLGSSRTTYFNQNDFVNMNIFNYSSSSMFPYEYKGYIDFAKKLKGSEFKYIIIGADFFGTNVPRDIKFKNPEFYINNTTSFLYKYKTLLSLDALRKSLANVKNYLRGSTSYYSRDNIKYEKKATEKERLERYTVNLKRHTIELSGEKYTYNEEYLKQLQEIKNDNPNTKFIIFTSAVTADLYVSIIKNANRIQEYERWLREILEVFDEVHNFMTINSITTNLENYPDDDHAYPHIVKLIANKISNHQNKNIPKDFGVLVTKENIDEHLKNLREQVQSYDLNKI